jgi:hypothetical protein
MARYSEGSDPSRRGNRGAYPDSPDVDPAGGSETRRSDRPEFDDSEETARLGMSSEGAAADEAESMASTGDSEGTFIDIAAGTATGLGLDRGLSMGTGGLAAGEDLDPVAEGDYWRENFRRRPYYDASKGYEHYEPGYQLGWESAGVFEGLAFEEIEEDLAETWNATRSPGAPDWDGIREATRDAFLRARGRDEE